MPLYMDIHEVNEATPEDIAEAHNADVATQKQFGVEYVKYWFNEDRGKVFCLCQAPSSEAANRVHREAHGLVAEKIIEVEPELVEAFLGNGRVNPAGAVVVPGGSDDERDPGIRTVLFTDIVDSTPLTQRMGDEAAMAFIRVHDGIVRDALNALGGREVKHTGDGIMASFASAASAVRCAARIQRGLAQHRQDQAAHPIRVRIGAAAGVPVEHRNDLFGSTVQLAARLCSQAAPEQILVSSVIADLCLGKGLCLQDLGEVSLRGFESPVRVHAVDWSGHAE
jgi:class 3 adenylate cyclase